MPRVLAVGFDGATANLIEPLLAAGRLPTLARMRAAGSSGTLASTQPPITPTAWTTFFTGKNPGKHGIFDFQALDAADYTLRSVRTDRHDEAALWDLLGAAGLQSLIIDVPFTWPPRPLNGWMITGYGTPRTPGTAIAWPSDLAEQLPPDLRAAVRVALPQHRFDRSQAFIDEWRAIMAERARLLGWLVRNRPWDLFMTVFSITDNMAHVFWTYADPAHPNYHRPEAAGWRNALHEAYVTCDAILGELIDAAGADTITLVMSDHGFGSIRPRQYLFSRLAEGGYLRYAAAATHGGGRLTALRNGAIRSALRAYNRWPRLREWVKSLRPAQAQRVKRTLAAGGLLPGGNDLDFAQTRAIPSGFGVQIWINDRARFAGGCVAPAAVAALRAELRDYLLADRDPLSGAPIIRAVYTADELYDGAHAAAGPDLVIDYNDLFGLTGADGQLNPFSEGGHIADGVLFAAGPSIARGTLHGARLIDLAPTILHLLGQPLPADIDGQLLYALLTPAALAAHPPRTTATPARRDVVTSTPAAALSAAESADLARQLRQLGYID